MTKNVSILLIFLFKSLGFLTAQQVPQPEQIIAIQTMVNGYNNQDFQMMKEPWGLLGKILVTKKRLHQEYEPNFQKFGKITVDTVVCYSTYSCKALLNYEKAPYKRGYWQFIFNDNQKLQGFGNAYPFLLYPEKELQAERKYDTKQKAHLIDSLIENKYEKNHPYDFNGCILATENGTEVYKKCFGNTKYDNNTKLNDSTRFLLASCSKQFTAMAIMILEEEGKLKFNDDIQTFLPELPYEGITIEHLLTHTSGLPDYMPLLKKYWDKSEIATNQDVIDLLISYKPKVLFSPNAKFKYSNTGYVLLASIIEKMSGQRYGDFLQKHIFKPLGMVQTIVIARRMTDSIPSNYAYGYVYNRKTNKYVLPDSMKEYDHVIYMDGIVGDDGVSSSINDLAIWTKSLDSNQLIGEKTMVRARTRHILNSGQKVNYGYGFFLEEGENVNNLIYHTGGWPGYFTLIMKFVQTGETVIVLSNNSFDPFLNLADDVAGVLLYR